MAYCSIVSHTGENHRISIKRIKYPKTVTDIILNLVHSFSTIYREVHQSQFQIDLEKISLNKIHNIRVNKTNTYDLSSLI